MVVRGASTRQHINTLVGEVLEKIEEAYTLAESLDDEVLVKELDAIRVSAKNILED